MGCRWFYQDKNNLKCFMWNKSMNTCTDIDIFFHRLMIKCTRGCEHNVCNAFYLSHPNNCNDFMKCFITNNRVDTGNSWYIIAESLSGCGISTREWKHFTTSVSVPRSCHWYKWSKSVLKCSVNNTNVTSHFSREGQYCVSNKVSSIHVKLETWVWD